MMVSNNDSSEAKNLEDIKKLLILMLLDKGYSQSQLGGVLGTSQAGISRMFDGGVPTKKSK